MKDIRPQKTANVPFWQAVVRRFGNTQSAPRVVIPPLPRTFRKYCAQSEKTATSPNCKQSSAAQRGRDACGTATRMSASLSRRLSVFFGSTPRPRPKSGKTCRSDTRPGEVRERATRIKGSDSTPIRNAPCFGVWAAVCDSLSRAGCVPAFTRESKRGPFVGEVEKRDEKRSEIELLLIVRVHREPGNVCI